MQVRVECPACGESHVFDMPEGTIYMTCSRTGKTIEVRLGSGGDPRSRLVGGEPVEAGEDSEE